MKEGCTLLEVSLYIACSFEPYVVMFSLPAIYGEEDSKKKIMDFSPKEIRLKPVPNLYYPLLFQTIVRTDFDSRQRKPKGFQSQ